MGRKFSFNWKDKTIKNLPIKMRRNTTRGKGLPRGHMVCNECENRVSQKYECNECGNEYTYGDIQKRLYKDDDDSIIIYDKDERKQFLKQETDTDIEVIKEIDGRIFKYLTRLFKRDYEVYSNDENTIPIIKKVYNYLFKKDKILLIKYGKDGENKTGVLYADYDRMVCIELKNAKQIKAKKQLNLPDVIPENLLKEIEVVLDEAQNGKIELWEKFVEMKKQGKTVKKKEEKPKKSKPEKYADDLSSLEV